MIASSPPRGYTIPNGSNAAITMAQVAAFAGFLWLALVYHAWWQVLLLALAFGLYMNSVYSIIHEAEHGILFSQHRANDAVARAAPHR